MAKYIKLYFITLVPFFVIDMLWLGLVAKNFYGTYLGYLMAPNPNWLAAVLFYLLFLVGALVFVIIPGLEKHSLKATLLRGALFGLVTYATYDLTNLATVKDWPLVVTVVDLAWGTTVSTLTGALGYLGGRWLGWTE
jgi:uncharacterized membrane protein